MEQGKIVEKLEKQFKRIEKFIDSNAGSQKSYGKLYCTKLGKKLGRNIDKIQEFSFKGILTVFPFNSFIRALKSLYADERYLELLDSKDADTSRHLIELIKTQIIPDLETSEFLQIFNKTDEMMFLGSLVTSIYAFIDGYTRDVLSSLTRVTGVPRRILRNLGSSMQFSFKELDEIVSNPNEHYERMAFDYAKNRSINDRLRLIKSGTGLWDCIDVAISTTKLGEYKQHFEDFITLRHSFAHENPIPTTTKFLDNEMIKGYVDQLREKFKQDLSDIQMPSDVLSDVFDIVMDWFEERQTPLGIILQLTAMASVYPAIIDNSLETAFSLM